MSKIQLMLETQDNLGRTTKVFRKEIESPHTPNKDMVFSGGDYTLEARNVYFDLDYGTITVRFVEYLYEDEVNGWDFLLKSEEGWTDL